MPRHARVKSETGIYHIMSRGINREDIFHEADDYLKYLDALYQVKGSTHFQILGYCLMPNHVHLLVREGEEDISNTMKRIGVRYAPWYNRKYQRNGHVFQGRYKSENVEDDTYLLTVIRYIHQNPVKAGFISKPEEYKYSSCQDYYNENYPQTGLTNTEFILSIFSEDPRQAVEEFKKYNSQKSAESCLDDEVISRISDDELRKEIRKLLKSKPETVLQQMEKAERDEILRKIKEIPGSRLRQIAGITGLGLYIIHQA